jgi:hypothetical protein
MAPKYHYPPISGGRPQGAGEGAIEGAGDDEHLCGASAELRECGDPLTLSVGDTWGQPHANLHH